MFDFDRFIVAVVSVAVLSISTGQETRVDEAPAAWGVSGQTIITLPGDSAHLIGWTDYPPLGASETKLRIMVRRETGDQVLERPFQVSTTPSANGGVGGLQLVAAGNVIYAFWLRGIEITPAVNYELRFGRSLDGGKTWTPDARIAPLGLDASNGFAAALGSAGQLSVAFSGTRGTESHVDFIRSVDGGIHWSAPVQVDHAPQNAFRPAIAQNGNAIAIVWDDGRGGGAVFGNSSQNGGATFRPTDALVASVATTNIQLFANGAARFCAFFEATGQTGFHALSTCSQNGGARWGPLTSIDEGKNGIKPFTMSASTSNGVIHTVAYYAVNGVPGLYYRRSVDNGVSYQIPLRMDAAPSGTQDFFTAIAASPRGIVVVPWAQLQTGTAPGIILARISGDDGATWSALTRLSGSPVVSRAFPVVAADPTGAVAAWTQGKSPQQKLFFNVIETR